MRMLLRAVVIFLSFDTLFVLLDWFGVWQWGHEMTLAYPAVAAVLKGPFLPLLCLGMAILITQADKVLKRPDLRAEYLRFELFPKKDTINLHDIQKKDYAVDADMLLKIYLVNHAPYSVAIREFKGQLFVMRNWLVRFPKIARYVPQRRINLEKAAEFEAYHLKREQRSHDGNLQTTYTGIPSLEKQLAQVPLERGIPYEGWIGFTVSQIDNRDLANMQIRVTVRDALDNIHKVTLRDKSVEQLRNWDEKVIPPL